MMLTDMMLITIYGWIGWATLTLILVALYGLTGYLGWRVFVRLTRVYHLRVIVYWLKRLEREGTHAFERSDGSTPGHIDPMR